MLFRARSGAEILEKIDVNEEDAFRKYPEINHVLAIVKTGNDYLLGYHKWRSDWETFGGRLEKGESLRKCIRRECKEELGICGADFEYLGVVHYYMPPDYWVKDWHEEFGGLYGITLPEDALRTIEANRCDKEEIGRIELYSVLKKHKENIDEINERLLRFY